MIHPFYCRQTIHDTLWPYNGNNVVHCIHFQLSLLCRIRHQIVTSDDDDGDSAHLCTMFLIVFYSSFMLFINAHLLLGISLALHDGER